MSIVPEALGLSVQVGHSVRQARDWNHSRDEIAERGISKRQGCWRCQIEEALLLLLAMEARLGSLALGPVCCTKNEYSKGSPLEQVHSVNRNWS